MPPTAGGIGGIEGIARILGQPAAAAGHAEAPVPAGEAGAGAERCGSCAGGSGRRGLFLDGPAVAIRVAEECERVPRPAVAVLPLAFVDVADRGDVHPGVGELMTR